MDFSEQNPHPILRYNKARRIVYANPSALELIRTTNYLEHRDEILEKLVRVEETGKSVRNQLTIDERTYAFTFNAAKEPGFINVYAHDVTEEVQLKGYFEVLSGFSAALLKGHSGENVAEILAREAISRLGYVDFMVYLYNPTTDSLMPIAGHGPESPRDMYLSPSLDIPLGQGIVGSAARQKHTVIVNDLHSDTRYLIDDGKRASEISVPILVGGELLGVIDSEHHEKNRFTETDRRILEAVAALAGTRLLEIRADRQRKKTELQFETFVENAFGGFYILRNERFKFVNQPMCEILGYSMEELTDPDFDVANLMVESDNDFDRVIRARRRGDHARKSYQLKVKTKSGETKYLAINTSVLVDEIGTYTLGIALDITDWVNDKKQLEALNVALEQRNEELNDFVHLASHNLRAPVTNLEGLLEFYNFEQPGDPTNLHLITDFRNSVGKLNLILEEMHTVLNVKSKGLFKYGDIDLNQSLNSVRMMLRNQIEASDIEIETNFSVLNFHYVESHISNIFLNMISNAIKFRHPERKPLLRISSMQTNNGIRLSFKDNGMGLDVEKYGRKIFKLYTRFHSKTEGRGIGLYLVKKQLDLLGGEIRVDSEVGEGTTFVIDLKVDHP